MGTKLYTVPEIAIILGEPKRRVSYIILKYQIQPDMIAGKTRLFNNAQIGKIKRGMYHIELRGQTNGG